jgi:SAM-dependent methyltransferase
MVLKELIAPLPGVRRVNRLRKRLTYKGSAAFWEHRYAKGGWSGPGSYGDMACGKAAFLNAFVHEHGISSVIEFGCGDGNQLSLAKYPNYVGLDVSKSAIELCIPRFSDDRTKSFYLYDSLCFADRRGLFSADLVLSLDVIFHLTEELIYETYMSHLFTAARQYVIVYSTNSIIRDEAPHVLHRRFSSWVDANCPQWRLNSVTEGPGSGELRADFYIYERSAAPSERSDRE